MAYNYEYPYVDPDHYNSDWLINKVKELAEEWTQVKGEWNNTEAEWKELHDYVMNYFSNLNLQEEVNTIVREMAEDGTIDNIINQDIFGTFNAQISNLQQSKRNKSDTNYVTMAMLTQDVKTAMTGGSVAVVGANSVNTVNIVNGAVTKEKLAASTQYIWGTFGTVNLNTVEKTITFNCYVSLSSHLYKIEATYPVPDTATFMWVSPVDNTTAEVLISSNVSGVYIGTVSPSSLSMIPGVRAFIDSVSVDVIYGNGLPFLISPSGSTYPLMEFHFENSEVITRVSTISVRLGDKVFNLKGLPLQIPSGQSYLVFDYTNSELSFKSGAFNGDRYYCIAYVNANTYFVKSPLPVLSVSAPLEYYSVNPAIVMYGDSIVAGSGGYGFTWNLYTRDGIYIRNRGIGSVGYTRRVTAGSTHLAGNDNPFTGTDKVIEEAENNIQDQLTRDISDIAENYVAIFAGTNDITPIEETIGAVEACIDIIQTAGKFPIILTPLLRVSRDVQPLCDAIIALCAQKGVPCKDMTKIGLNPKIAAIRTAYMPDGLHPNNAGYGYIARHIAHFLKNFVLPLKI